MVFKHVIFWWFLSDVEDRMKNLLISSISEEENAGDTFAERAEWYYQKRPQLLALLKDLYNGYITLLDRCQQSQRKHKHHFRRNSSSEITAVTDVDYQNEEYQENGESEISQIESDAESTISYQQQTTMAAAAAVVAPQNYTNIDSIVAELVTKNVENDILLNQVNDMDQLSNESSKKIELLKNLLDLLESERIILINENVKLGYKVSSLMEENKGLASDAMFMKRKAAELARCVLRMREDHRVCILSQKIEDLQEQIYGLEKRNKEYYQMLVKREQEAKEHQKSCIIRMEKMDLESCLQLEKIKLQKKASKKMKGSKWWERVKKAELFNCGLYPSSA